MRLDIPEAALAEDQLQRPGDWRMR